MTDVHAKAKRGIKLLMGRQVLLQLLTFGGGVILARVLGPAQFGLYAIASFLVSTFAVFGDFGLAPSLIQRKDDLTERDIHVAFTVQQIVTTCVVIAVYACSPWLARFYPKAAPETVWLVRALAFNLYMTSWRTMSALQLERHLKYDRLAKIEVVESLTYQFTAVVMAVTGHGVWSYVVAILANGVVGSSLVYLASPWKIRFAFDRKIAADILRFGIPFQLQQLSNQLGGWATPVLVGSVIGPAAVGYLSWASSNGKKPLMLVDNVMRVAFPHFSRIQDDRDEVVRTIVKYLTYLLIASSLWFAVILVAGPSIVPLIYSSKWTPAVPALILFSGALSFDVVSWVTCVSLNSMGMVKFVTRMVFARSATSMVLTVILVLIYGLIGVPVAYLIAATLLVPVMVFALGAAYAKQIALSIAWILLPLAVSIIFGETIMHSPMPTLWRGVLSIAAVTASFGITCWLAGPESIRQGIRRRMGRVALGTASGVIP